MVDVQRLTTNWEAVQLTPTHSGTDTFLDEVGFQLSNGANDGQEQPAHCTIRGVESEALLLLLDQEGICASSGSACLADSDEPSHVVKAMKPDSTASREMVRLSFGSGNTMREVKVAVASIQKAVSALRG